jgi:hypothetical protein
MRIPVVGLLSLCIGSCFEAVESGEEVFDVRRKLLVGNILRGPAQCLADALEKVDVLDPGGVFGLVHLHYLMREARSAFRGRVFRETMAKTKPAIAHEILVHGSARFASAGLSAESGLCCIHATRMRDRIYCETTDMLHPLFGGGCLRW